MTEPDTVVVGRIGRPHGVRGEVTVEVRTDDPDLRFTPGAVLLTDPADRGPLTVAGARWHREILLLALEGPGGRVIGSREEAEELRNTQLLVEVSQLPALDDPDDYYDHQLVGLTARLTGGEVLGRVVAVEHEGAARLVVEKADGGEVLVPFVAAIVPTVDLAAGEVVIDPPEGLLEL